MRGPDMGGNVNGLRAAFQHNFQQIPAVQPQDGPAVAVQIADGLQPVGKPLRRVQPRQNDHMMHLPGFPVPFINGADFACNHEARLPRVPGGAGQAVFFFELINTVPILFKHFFQFFAPLGVGKIPGAHQADPLVPGPHIQMRRVAVTAGGPGKAVMNMKIRDPHRFSSFRSYDHICSAD